MGVGMGLTFDEAALLLDLRDVYWTREGLLSVQVSLALTAILGIAILDACGCCAAASGARRRPGRSRRLLRSIPPRPISLTRGSGGAQRRPLADPDHLVAGRADADEPDRHADELADEAQVVAGLRRQVRLAAAVADLVLEARAAPRTRRSAVCRIDWW